jgi:dTDP-4-amino-4,6-dideoxygalactose transaminase
LSVKLRRLDGWNARRRTAMAAYREQLDGSLIAPVLVGDGVSSACHLNVVRVPRRRETRSALRERGIETRVHYPLPCHRQAAYKRFTDEPLPVAEQAATEVLSLPLSPHISLTQIETVCCALRHAVEECN